MLIQTQAKSKSRTPLLIVLGLLVVITIIVAYRASSGGSSGEIAAPDMQVPIGTIITTYSTDILNDVRIKGLKHFGAADVQVAERGRRPDPFAAF